MYGKYFKILFVLVFCIFKDACCEFEIEEIVDDDKIVGGTNVNIKKLPYQAFIRTFKGNRYFQCGGSIISKEYILTAAHCLYGMDEAYVRTGSTEYDDINNALILAKSFKSHPNYTHTSHDNDIGVVQLARKLDLSGKTEKIIKLVDAGTKLPVGGKLTVSGWGVTSEDGRVSRHLKDVQIQIVSDADCRKMYKEEFTENMFCAGVPEGGKDACQGDSGGPGVLTDNGIQVGVVSYGRGCGRAGTPGVFANLASKAMREWIKDATGV
ncbi:trypsin alpha-3-like [Leptidea sinapis]|uniref:trypsin alpha-3-like n=1 Tax=Leptidea sinapis TaxID=189913 RepID=UPI00212B1102|nr:trypsin alpha-3-like [Leptidea sinapis]